jgi:hypothetical protein
MKNNFKGGKSANMTAFDVAKKWKISPIEFMPILEKGTEHEMEHTDNEDIARRIALDHIVERLDYYDKLEKIEKMEKGGRFDDQKLLKEYNANKSIGFSAIAHLKSKGLIPRADGQKRKSEKYMEKGGRTIAQTPAPASDRVSGSKTNPKGSASDTSLARSIKFNDSFLKAIENKVKAHNEEYPSKKVTTPTAKAVVRRGMGAYSKSHRPFITGGAPNSRQAWGLARLNKFLLKKRGVKVKSAYIQDDDLL